LAKARIGHLAEAQVLEALEVDYIDERPPPPAIQSGARVIGYLTGTLLAPVS
jgi:hypothetical protein